MGSKPCLQAASIQRNLVKMIDVGKSCNSKTGEEEATEGTSKDMNNII
jgi:hypothetical protein